MKTVTHRRDAMERTIESCLLKFLLMRKAVLRDGEDVEPGVGRTWSECFTVECGKWLCLWYNVKATGLTKIQRFRIS
jgi:hypothetical protein